MVWILDHEPNERPLLHPCDWYKIAAGGLEFADVVNRFTTPAVPTRGKLLVGVAKTVIRDHVGRAHGVG